MTVVWHRLGKEHPLVEQLDRLSCEQRANLHARQRARRRDEVDSEHFAELEAEQSQLAGERAVLEDQIRTLLIDRSTHATSAAKAAARAHFVKVLSQRHPQRHSREATAG